VWAQSAILGVGGAMAAAGGNPLICLLTAVPLCFVAGADAAQAVLPGPVRGQLLLLLGPVVAGGLFGRQQAGLVVALLAAVALGMALAVAAATSARATQAASHIAPVAMPPVGHTLPPAAQDFQRLLGRCQVTGLPNRHSFAHLLVQESTRACSAETKLSLLLLQWDGFDTYSAAAKPARLDAQLAGLARRLGGELRRSADVLANLGDGRFAVLLPFTDASGAGTVARNLQAALRLPELGDGAEVGANRVSVSIGAATYCGKGPLPDDQLMRFAEEALSAARATGGDRVKNYDPIAATLRPAPYAGPRPKEEASARSRERLSG
jgi:diguanylate cyclase (GGDEF)-like protein